MSDIWRLSASRVARLIRERQLSAAEVAQSALTRLDDVNPRLNAVVDHRPDEVLARARTVDAMLARGEDPGVLAGVPVTVKVNVDQQGFATTNGLTLQRDLVATSNSPVVDNLLRAGAVILGRTNTPAFSYRWFTSNKLHGRTVNPRNASLTPGGSSGGAASSVAAGIGHIAHGTDIAGSVRYPAYACGVHGLRPTLGRVAAYNATGAERNIGAQLMAVSGPLARTVEDVRLGLAALAGADARDPWWTPAPLTGPAVARKVAVCLRPDGLDTDPAIATALLDAAERLRNAGWTVDEVDALPPIEAACRSQITLWMADGYDALVRLAEREGDSGAITALAGQAEIGRTLDAAQYSAALVQRAGVTRQWLQFLERYPVVLLPVSGELPFPDDLDLRGPEGYARVWKAQMPMVGLAITGLPALTVTTGMLGDVPVGVQVVAGRYREDLCLAVGDVIQAEVALVS